MTINLHTVRHFFTSISEVASREPIPNAPPYVPHRARRSRNGVPDHVCPPVRERVVMVSRECEQALIKALGPFPEARSAVAHVLKQFLYQEPAHG